MRCNICAGRYVENVTDKEKHLLICGALKFYEVSEDHPFTQKQYNSYKDQPKKIYNDRESAIIGVDLMQQNKINETFVWSESKAVTSKIGNYNKLNSFISTRYADELKHAKIHYFNGKLSLGLNKRCHSMLGYCVEYYSKWLLYGDPYLGSFIKQAMKEAATNTPDDLVIIRACMFKYKALMVQCFGTPMKKIIKTMSVEQLEKREHDTFVKLIMWLGLKTANYVKSALYSEIPISNNIDPNLSIRHIAGLADYITKDTILDVKVRNTIDENCVRQVLAYHYLSTKRSDLDIKQVIIYDAISDRSIIIPIGDSLNEPAKEVNYNYQKKITTKRITTNGLW